MSSLHEVRWRLLWERLVKVYGEGQQHEAETLPHGLAPDDNAELLARLAGTTLALLERHAMDGKGRCRVRGCSQTRWWWLRKRQTCQRFVTVQFWLGQPLEIVQKVGRQW
ncbi:MAG: hypothetical protein ACRDTE_20115 [Pseudonocardiaceae bacterium]